MHKLNFARFSSFFVFMLLIGFTACQKDALVETPLSDNSVISSRSNGTIVDIAVSNPDFSALVAAVVKTDLVEFLSRSDLDATVFAPNNAAFAALPTPFNNAQNISNITDQRLIKALGDILRYHVAPGANTAAMLSNGSYKTFKNAATPNDNRIFVGRDASDNVFINGNTQVIAADIQADNGVIHVINKVLIPPSQDVAQIAISNDFTALVAALQKTRLTNLFMMSTTDATVFAPTDDAFAALPAPLNNAANIKAITDPATINLLRNVLRYHVVGGRVFSADLRDGITVPTLLPGATVDISLAGGAMVTGAGNTGGSNIVLTDLLARNGVIHVIDQVLLP